MSYVKNGSPGKITMDLPRENYIYELPLLSFSDVHGSLNLSLVFNHQMWCDQELSSDNEAFMDDPFCIKHGFKLNVQKYLKIDGGYPLYLIDNAGRRVEPVGSDYPYGFDDDSQGVLHQTGIGAKPYAIVYPDHSMEYYNADGMIVSVVNKYNVETLRFSYNARYGYPTMITYRNSKNIQIACNSGNKIQKIFYPNTGCQTTLVDRGDRFEVQHYSGEIFELYNSASGSPLFSAQLSTPNHKTEVYKSGEVFTISDFIDDVAFNTTSYKFGSNLVDVTNNEGITTRIQYQYGKPICSYELIGDMSQDVFNVGSIHVHKTMENDEDGVSGTTINYRTGIGGRTDDLANNEVHFDVSSYVASGSHGRYVLTGWMKRDVPDDGDWIAAGDTTIQVINGYGGPIIKEFTPNAPDDGQWRFFAYTFYANVNSLTFNLPDNPSIHVAGLRLSHEGIDKNIDASYFSFQSPEYILISNSSTGCKHIPISAATFRYQRKVDGVTTAFNLSQHGVVCFEDLFRFKFNKRKGAFQSEAYANKGKLVLDGDQRGTLTVTYTDPASNQTYTYNVDQCHLGICQYTQAGEVVTRIRDVSTNTFLLYETTCDGTSFTQKVNNFLDVIEEEENDVVKTIARNQDLISSISVTDRNNTNNSFTKSLEYITEDECNIIVETDEFGDSVTFVLDPIWGTVKSTTMPDDSEVSNSYDDDMCALTKRVFGDAAGRANMMTYSNGRISAVESGSLSYAFSYDKNKLSAVSKNASSIEEHTHTTEDATGDPKTVSYYPSESSTLYSTNTVFDKYGNLKNVEGILEIEYKDLTGFDDNDMPVYGNATRDCSAKVCEDKLCGEKITLVHDITGKAIREDITDATSNALIRQEKFKYDKVGRLSKSHLDYNLTENQSVSTAISYVKKANKPLPDNRVEDFAYGVNFQGGIFDNGMTDENCDALAKTTNTYDSFKRVTAKKHVVGGKTFNKLFHYTKTRVTSTSEKIGNTTVNSTEYQYNDHCGRITAVITGGKTTSYHYDLYGQLVREDNKPLDATFVYVYNEIGNLTSIEKYAYTASSVTPSGTPITTTIGYTNDKLTNFGGTTISYNSIGCPTTYEGKTAIWARGKLSRLSVGTMATGISNYAYTYNAFGQRIGKTYTYTPGKSASAQLGDLLSYSKSYYYDYAGRLISESVFKTYYGTDGSSENIVFLYDESGIIGIARTVGSTTNAYYFQRNLLGDVVAIYDTSGNMVAKYLYDAWGNCTISSETTNTVVANANPIRYRGYYYDDDTGLYYCNARYYSSKWHRFISPNDTAYLNHNFANGLNLYCYHENNPMSNTCHVDDSMSTVNRNIMHILATPKAWKERSQLNLPEIPWLINKSTTLYGTYSAISAGIPIFAHYFKYAKTIGDEFRLYGVSKWKTSLQLADVNLKMTGLDGILLGINVVLDIYDSKQRGVSPGGVVLGAGLTAATGVGMLYLNKGIMWACTTVGTAICPGVGTTIGFVVGLAVSITVDWILGDWIASWIDSVAT